MAESEAKRRHVLQILSGVGDEIARKLPPGWDYLLVIHNGHDRMTSFVSNMNHTQTIHALRHTANKIESGP